MLRRMAGVTHNRLGIFCLKTGGNWHHGRSVAMGRREGAGPMSGSRWRKFMGVDRRALGEARLQAHYAAQWLARTARAYVTARPDDHHTNLGWDDAIGGLTTHALPQGTVLGL